MKVYEKVRVFIEERGYKQSWIAEKVGMPIDKFTDIMEGRKTLYADDLREICLALNVSPEVFIEVDKSTTKG